MPLRKFHGRQVRRTALLGTVIVGLVGCVALPPGSVDPLATAIGLPSKEEAAVAQPQGEPWAPVGTATRVPSEPSRQFRPRGVPSAESQWLGRYRDTRGDGEIALELSQDGDVISGRWQLRTGGAGTFLGTLAREGQAVAFTMQGRDHECPSALAGRGEYLKDRIRGTYTGSDCVGAFTGSLELKRQ